MIGKTQPFDLEAEKAVLGAILLENNSIEEVITILKDPSDFYDLKHQIIYSAILEMYGKSKQMDIITIAAWLRTEGLVDQAGGYVYITELTGFVSSSIHIGSHVKIIAEQAIGRKILSLAQKIISDGNKAPDYLELLEKMAKEVYKIEGNYFTKDTQSILALSKEVMQEVERAGKKADGITGEISGIEALDDYTKGFGKQDLIIIAARPGMGKSSLVHTIMRNRAVDHKKPIALFSLEMSSLQVTKVLHSHQTGLDHQLLKDGKLSEQDWKTYHEKIQPLLQAPLYIDDTPAISLSELRAKSRRLVSKFGVSMIIVDYLQLMTVGYEKNRRSGNREQEISEISRGLKALAKELDIPIIALAQLSRASESRSTKLPQLSDLRDSGAIEQDADMVMFLFRPAYYGMEQDEAGNAIPKHLTKAIIAKYREGELGDIDLGFIGRMKMFYSNPYGGNKEYSETKSKMNSQGSMHAFDNDNGEMPF
jgi:replicative DNA helicase